VKPGSTVSEILVDLCASDTIKEKKIVGSGNETVVSLCVST
jgi:predicted transcriptional regulator